jgi:hypothetical protein
MTRQLLTNIPADIEHGLLRELVARYPTGGTNLEASLRDAIRTTWKIASQYQQRRPR